MLKKILPLFLLMSTLTIISCSNASKNITPEKEKEAIVKTNTNYNDKIIQKYENQGIVLTSEQKEQINKLMISSDNFGQSKDSKRSAKLEIRKNIEQNILTAEQRALIKKRDN